MSKERVQRFVISSVVALFVASALGYLLAPENMLSIVGMESTPATDFLVRTVAAALLALTPGAWALRKRTATSGQRGVLVGLAVYMFASSLVDFGAFVDGIVGFVSIPSIVIRVLVVGIIVWLIPQPDLAQTAAGAASSGSEPLDQSSVNR